MTIEASKVPCCTLSPRKGSKGKLNKLLAHLRDIKEFKSEHLDGATKVI